MTVTALAIGEVAARSGVAPSALRYYEAEGLISSERSAAGQRRFSRDVLRRVAVIKTAQSLGMPLSEIKAAFAELPARRTPTTGDWQKLSRRWRKRISIQIEQLVRLRDYLDDCIGCGCLSLASCPLRNPQDIAAEAGPGPRLFMDVEEV
jgi:MerR family transcriptional regulator, redox-sensitive transcriptional activator SoxR